MMQSVTSSKWDFQRALRELERLIAPEVLGFYTHFEATVIFGFPPGQREPVNVFTILVAEERPSDATEEPHYLNDERRIVLKSLKDWSFGVQRYLKPIAELVPAFDVLRETKAWRASGHALRVGDLNAIPTQFVAPDFASGVPWNRVLKNNFWNGSHVFEWADSEKTVLKPFFDYPPVLQELSQAVRAHVPVALGSLSDRLGNVVVQLPVTVLMSKFGQMRESGDFTVSVAWNPKASPRSLRATCALDFDDAISGFNSRMVEDDLTLLPMQDGPGLHRAVLWDDENRVLLAASGAMSFIRSVALNLHVMDPEPRIFSVPDGTGGKTDFRVALMPHPIKNIVGDTSPNPAGEWRQFRMYREETIRLAEQRRFVQYRPISGQQPAMHERAIADLRFLINRHGAEGAWLWDPYLSAMDVIKTLFHCCYDGSDLRALSGGETPPPETAPADEPVSPPVSFTAEQRAVFDRIDSNWRGLCLQFRVRVGSTGWPFHDRFLIFPAADRGAQAWSLGTSVNALGKQHHILQRVDDGQRIRDAFEDLWNLLDKPEHLVWRTP
jgi:hypothetical protein